MGLRSEVEALAFGRRNDTFQIEKNGGNGAEKSYTLRGGGDCVGKGWGMREIS